MRSGSRRRAVATGAQLTATATGARNASGAAGQPIAGATGPEAQILVAKRRHPAIRQHSAMRPHRVQQQLRVQPQHRSVTSPGPGAPAVGRPGRKRRQRTTLLPTTDLRPASRSTRAHSAPSIPQPVVEKTRFTEPYRLRPEPYNAVQVQHEPGREDGAPAFRNGARLMHNPGLLRQTEDRHRPWVR